MNVKQFGQTINKTCTEYFTEPLEKVKKMEMCSA